MIVTAFFPGHGPDRRHTVRCDGAVFINTRGRGLGVDLGHGYRTFVLGTGPITVSLDEPEQEPDVKPLPPRERHQEVLDQRLASIRTIYAQRRERQHRQQRLRWCLEWGVLLLALVGALAWLSWHERPRHQVPSLTVEDQP